MTYANIKYFCQKSYEFLTDIAQQLLAQFSHWYQKHDSSFKTQLICLLLKAYMYADQTSKLLVIFLCLLVCICDCYTKCFSAKTFRQLFGSHLLCCFLSTYVFLDVLSLKTLSISSVQTILQLEIWFRKSNSLKCHLSHSPTPPQWAATHSKGGGGE